MRKKIIGYLIASIAIVAAFIDGYVLFFKNKTEAESQTTINQASQKTSSSDTSSSSTESSSSEKSSSSSSLKDGTYTGDSTSTEWGDVQVQITISSGKISSIKVLAYPDSHQKSIMINEQVLPVYKSEALSAQSANIDQVSGATETYKGFTGSLQSAITQAES